MPSNPVVLLSSSGSDPDTDPMHPKTRLELLVEFPMWKTSAARFPSEEEASA